MLKLKVFYVQNLWSQELCQRMLLLALPLEVFSSPPFFILSSGLVLFLLFINAFIFTVFVEECFLKKSTYQMPLNLKFFSSNIAELKYKCA